MSQLATPSSNCDRTTNVTKAINARTRMRALTYTKREEPQMLTLVLLAASILAPSPSAPILTPAFDVSVSIAPSSLDHYQLLRRKTPETFTCRAWVRDASSNSGFGWAE